MSYGDGCLNLNFLGEPLCLLPIGKKQFLNSWPLWLYNNLGWRFLYNKWRLRRRSTVIVLDIDNRAFFTWISDKFLKFFTVQAFYLKYSLRHLYGLVLSWARCTSWAALVKDFNRPFWVFIYCHTFTLHAPLASHINYLLPRLFDSHLPHVFLLSHQFSAILTFYIDLEWFGAPTQAYHLGRHVRAGLQVDPLRAWLRVRRPSQSWGRSMPICHGSLMKVRR